MSQHALGYKNGRTGIIAIQPQLGNTDGSHGVGPGSHEESLRFLDPALAATQLSEPNHALVRKGGRVAARSSIALDSTSSASFQLPCHVSTAAY